MLGLKDCMNPEKHEGMASVLILAGVVPLAVALVANHGFHEMPSDALINELAPYPLSIVMGIFSLLVKRAGSWWHFIGAIGATALLASAAISINQATTDSAAAPFALGNAAWALFMLVVLWMRYKFDCKKALKAKAQSLPNRKIGYDA